VNRRRTTWLAAFGRALQGISHAVRSERNMRFHLFAAACVAVLAAWLKVSGRDWLFLGAAAFGVLTAEMINTAVERVVDLASPREHELAKTAKDTAAGAVLVAALFAVAVGLAVLGPPLWRAISG
jgi:diacylglycerol kinase